MSQFALLEVDAAPVPKGDTPNWFTPLSVFVEREAELIAAGLLSGPCDLDPCGHWDAPVTRLILERGGVAYTAAENGLERPWRGRCAFLNPPYDARTVGAFLSRLALFLAIPGVSALAHIPAWTDRAWFQDHVEPDRLSGRCHVRFERGRLTYGWPGNPTGRGGDCAQFPSAWVAWPGKRPKRTRSHK